MERAVICDVDGVVRPVHGHTAWADDVVAGHVFGPVHVSPTLCARLDELAQFEADEGVTSLCKPVHAAGAESAAMAAKVTRDGFGCDTARGRAVFTTAYVGLSVMPVPHIAAKAVEVAEQVSTPARGVRRAVRRALGPTGG